MAARKKPKFNYAIICDDIRQEVGNKISLIGIYAKDIFVTKIPFTLPKLCFAINYNNIKGGDTFSIELSDPSGERLGGVIKVGVAEKIKGYVRFQIHAVFSPLVVKNEGDYKLIAIVNKDKKRKQEIVFAIKKAAIN
jgi:hypothetical protein